jgi:sphingolipid delta-4 desaturase
MGYHNEHHDLPSIPWNNLPKLRALAPEFYDTLKCHSSWSGLLFQFIFDKRYSLFSRIERTKQKDTSRSGSEDALVDARTGVALAANVNNL